MTAVTRAYLAVEELGVPAQRLAHEDEEGVADDGRVEFHLLLGLMTSSRWVVARVSQW